MSKQEMPARSFRGRRPAQERAGLAALSADVAAEVSRSASFAVVPRG